MVLYEPHIELEGEEAERFFRELRHPASDPRRAAFLREIDEQFGI